MHHSAWPGEDRRPAGSGNGKEGQNEVGMDFYDQLVREKGRTQGSA